MKLNLPLWAQIAANLLSLVLALALGWPAEIILFLFWAENLVIGLWQIPRFFVADSAKEKKLPNTFFTAVFFTLHYGLFTFAHGSLLFELFLKQPMNAQTLTDLAFGTPGIMLGLLGLFISHGLQFFSGLGTTRTMKTGDVMTEPYKRIVILHLVLLGSGFLLMKTSHPMVAVILLVAIKIVMDIKAERKTEKQQEVYVS
ncbi:DUF6498-containing protein [Thiolapillus sp.]